MKLFEHHGFRSAIALGAVCALALAACGGDDDDSASSTSGGNATTTTASSGNQTAGVTLDQECTDAKAKGVKAPAGFNVRLVTDVGRIDDGTFNQYSYDAMQAAKECFGFETSYIETTSEADYAKNIATTLAANPNVIITNGFLLADDTLTAAKANADVDFIGIDQFQDSYPTNYIGVLFREDQGGYLAGVMAASLSKSGVIGVVGGRQDVPPVVRFVNAYKIGAQSVNPDVRVLSTYNESFTDPNKGASDAQQFMGEGADVVFGAGGKTGSGGVAGRDRSRQVGHRRRPGRVLHHLQRWQGSRVQVPRDLGREARRPRGVPQHRRGARRLVQGWHLHPRSRQRRDHVRAVPPGGDPEGRRDEAREDSQGSGRRLDRHRRRPGHRQPELSTDDHVEARARAPEARGPVFAWQGLTQP